MAIGALIYQLAGLADTAHMFAQELIKCNEDGYANIGYSILLSKELSDIINKDSLDAYVADYRDLLERYYNDNRMNLAVTQEAFFNYGKHVREKEKEETKNHILKFWLIGVSFAAVFMLMIVFFIKNHNKRRIIEMQESLENINRLKQQLDKSMNFNKDSAKEKYEIKNADSRDEQEDDTIPQKITETQLRKKLQEELLNLYEKSSTSRPVSETILKSPVYEEILNKIESGKSILRKDGIWERLTDVVEIDSPDFMNNLILLTSGKLKETDLHTALLIKCGFKPSQMVILIGKSNGAIISRRDTLSIKVFDKKLEAKAINAIIRLL